MSKALDDVRSERQRQVDVEGWTPEHDDTHEEGEMAAAAACYAAPFRVFKAVERAGRDYAPFIMYVDGWPFHDRWWNPKDRRRDLVRAAALILAEIERLDRIVRDPAPSKEDTR